MRTVARHGLGLLRGLLALLAVLTTTIGVAAAPPFDFQALQALTASKRIGSIEALLAALPADLRTHYVLMFQSRSLQQGSFRDPRAILYSTDGRLMLSFNGDASQRGYETIESAEFEPATAAFRFREIRFLTGPAGGVADFSEIDPPRCQRCTARQPGRSGMQAHCGPGRTASAIARTSAALSGRGSACFCSGSRHTPATAASSVPSAWPTAQPTFPRPASSTQASSASHRTRSFPGS